MPANAILIVEDDGILCANMEDMLMSEGHGVMDVLPSGEAALELVKERLPDIIIMDIRLAGELDGISTVEQIKKIADIPVIYLTAHTDDTLLRRAMETVPYAYLVKPVQERELIATIEMTLHKHSLEQKLRETEGALRESEQRFRYVAEFSPLPLAILDQDGNFEYLNPRFAEVFGYTIADVPTRNQWLELAYPDPLYRWQAFEKWKTDIATIGKDEIRTGTFSVTCKNGHKKEILMRAVFMDNGKFLIIYEDITERKEAEEKLADYTLELENLYHRLDMELEKARQVHERTLPTAIPAVEGVSFAACYQPAQKMGGDFYDVLQRDNKLIFYLSDVSGHGLDGAMLSVFVKYTISSYISFTPPASVSPAAVLGHLARRFRQENYPQELFFCIFMAVLDLDTLELSCSGAGYQEKLLLCLGDGKEMQLTAKGLPITSYLLNNMLKIDDQTVVISPGTTIFCNTDGLTDETNSSGARYRDRLPRAFFKNAHLPPHLVANGVVEDFRSFTGGSLQGRDDITFLVLQLDPPEKETYHLELASNFGELSRLQAEISDLLNGISETEKFAASLMELAANAVEHGNRFDLEKVVSVDLTVMDSYLQATVEDQGAGFNWREILDSLQEQQNEKTQGVRGLSLVHNCSDRFFYNMKGNSATILVMREGER